MQKDKYKRMNDIRNTLLPNAQIEAKKYQRLVASLKSELDALIEQSKSIVADVPTVSDHALIRYLERFHGFDLDKFRKEMLTEERYNAILAGCDEIKLDKVTFKVSGKVIVTVV